MGRIPDDQLAALKAALDPVRVLERYTQVDRAGSDFKACCPIHREDTPSLHVYADRVESPYHCFGCDWHGDPIDLVREREGIDFRAAAELLRREYAPNLPPFTSDDGGGERRKRKPKRVAIDLVPEKAPPPRPEHWKHGAATEVYEYRNAAGQLRGLTARFEWTTLHVDGDERRHKDILPYRWARDEHGTEQWAFVGWTERPLYGEELLAQHPERPVLIVEGERTANAARRLLGDRYVVITWQGGGKAAKRAVLSPLTGRACWIWPDADEEGVDAAATLVQRLHDVVAASVHVVELEHVAAALDAAPKKGWDLADAPTSWTPDTVQAVLDRARDCSPPPPPSSEELPPCDDGEDPDQVDRDCAAFPLTDIGNAQRFVRRYGNRVRYLGQLEAWLTWNGTHWAVAQTGEAQRMAIETVRCIRREAAHAIHPYRAEDYTKHHEKAHGNHIRRSLLQDAQIMPGITVPTLRDFDLDPHLLAVRNGTVDLRTGELHPHRREDLITRCARVPYTPGARHPVFDAVLRTVSGGNPELASFLQLAMGVSLYGDNRTHSIFVLQGKAGGGKTTLLEGVMAALGDDLATATPYETFLAAERQQNQYELALLDGPRIVCADELKKSGRLDEGTLKWLSGGGTVTGRNPFGRPFRFRPRFTLWLSSNDAPQVSSQDEGVWRRVLRIPVNQANAPAQQDPAIQQAMLHDRACGAAILAWMVTGARRFAEAGFRLQIPTEIADATQQMRDELDVVSGFWADCCDFDAKHRAPCRAYRDAYLAWCEEKGVKNPASPRQMSDRLRERGVEGPKNARVDGQSVKCWIGVALKEQVEAQASLDLDTPTAAPREDRPDDEPPF